MPRGQLTDHDISTGQLMYGWAKDLFPLCRSLTGSGVVATLDYLTALLPPLQTKSVPSGTAAFDWTVPDEWNIRDACVTDCETGQRVIDFKRCNLHVVGYSEPVNKRMPFSELDTHLYSLPDQPDAVPYVTSYYSRRWGFAVEDKKRQALRANMNKLYDVHIDSSLAPGLLHYGELILPGQSDEEILLSSYVCHPSMANNELSGPCVMTALAQWLMTLTNRRFTYRILFLPETIGSILYLSLHSEAMKSKTKAGFVLTCIGDERSYGYLASRTGDTLADRVARHALKHHTHAYKSYSFLERGSDERQYCSPMIDLPVCSLFRSKYNEYPEYHTSLDNLDLITPAGLAGGYAVVRKCLTILEANRIYATACACEPQMGKRGLYPTLSTRDSAKTTRSMMNVLAYADGRLDLLGIAEKIEADAEELIPSITVLAEAGLLQEAGAGPLN